MKLEPDTDMEMNMDMKTAQEDMDMVADMVMAINMQVVSVMPTAELGLWGYGLYYHLPNYIGNSTCKTYTNFQKSEDVK